MTTIRRFCCNDLLRFTSVNLDHLTETFNMSFYMTYLARWPDYFQVAEGPGKRIMGYIMGKVEGQGESWHGHVTAVTVAPEYRRQQLAKKLMNLLEEVSDKIDKAYFVDLFVRASNTPAIKMYEKLGYVIYRRVLRYYSGEEDGLDMRKALSRDVEKKSIIPLKRPITPDELETERSESLSQGRIPGPEKGDPCSILLTALYAESSLDVEVEALQAFKRSVTRDLLGALANWTEANHHRHWSGIACDPSSSRVISISLLEIQLEGEISPFVGNLSSLQVLDLTSNSFFRSYSTSTRIMLPAN
ncbi:hypothetical protein V6N11_012179 [Hibiscus sabdariffa]|uniref:N-acetyltransferase domain-containing protein n=1 Tax=Hibiscus sabdariffa TaxID=183260 RepID=A0ABR2QAD6_9ROSI